MRRSALTMIRCGRSHLRAPWRTELVETPLFLPGLRGLLFIHDQREVARVEDAVVDLVGQSKTPAHFARQQRSGVAGEFAADEIGLSFSAGKTGRGDGLGATLCHCASLSVCWVVYSLLIAIQTVRLRARNNYPYSVKYPSHLAALSPSRPHRRNYVVSTIDKHLTCG